MKCEWVQENILLHIYNELPDDARYELEQHVARCTDCAGLAPTRFDEITQFGPVIFLAAVVVTAGAIAPLFSCTM